MQVFGFYLAEIRVYLFRSAVGLDSVHQADVETVSVLGLDLNEVSQLFV